MRLPSRWPSHPSEYSRFLRALVPLFLLRSPLLLEAGKTSVSPAPFGSRQLPTLPGRSQPSTISVWRLNFCVRYGYRWFPPAIVTGNFLASASPSSPSLSPLTLSLSRSLRPSGFAPLPHASRASASLSPRTFKTAQVLELTSYPNTLLSLSSPDQALDRLVSPSYTRYRASTDDLSTSSSLRGLTCFKQWQSSSSGGLHA